MGNKSGDVVQCNVYLYFLSSGVLRAQPRRAVVFREEGGGEGGEEGGGVREVRRREVRRRCQARVEHRALRARRWRVEGWGEEGDPFTSKGVHARAI